MPKNPARASNQLIQDKTLTPCWRTHAVNLKAGIMSPLIVLDDEDEDDSKFRNLD